MNFNGAFEMPTSYGYQYESESFTWDVGKLNNNFGISKIPNNYIRGHSSCYGDLTMNAEHKNLIIKDLLK